MHTVFLFITRARLTLVDNTTKWRSVKSLWHKLLWRTICCLKSAFHTYTPGTITHVNWYSRKMKCIHEKIIPRELLFHQFHFQFDLQEAGTTNGAVILMNFVDFVHVVSSLNYKLTNIYLSSTIKDKAHLSIKLRCSCIACANFLFHTLKLAYNESWIVLLT